jgi:histidyl-tRNA synthetase
MSKFEKVRGMHNIPVEETHYWSHVLNFSEKLMKSFSYSEIRLPIIEYTNLFERSVGSETDIVNKEMFTFNSKSDKSLTLRPEGTAGCMRVAINQGLLDKGPQRLFYSGPMYRYERPQKGRNREFFQLSAELFGIESMSAELEVFQIIETIVKKYKIQDSRLEINSLGSEEDQRNFSKALQAFLKPLKSKLDKDSQNRLEKNPLRILDSKSTETKEVLSNAPKIAEFRSKNSTSNFNLLKNLLNDFGIEYKENENLVRGLDYYNDAVFEWKSDSLGSQNTFCAGGRYDSLAKKLGGRQTPAIGASLGIDRLIIACKDKYKFPSQKLIAVILLDKNFLKQGNSISEKIRLNFPDIGVRFSGLNVNLKSELKRAIKNKFNFAIIIGREEVESSTYTIKDLDSEKNYEKLSEEKLFSFLNLTNE